MTDYTIYRVRKSFGDIKSGKGAYFTLEAAVKAARRHRLNVYTGSGELLYRGDSGYRKRRNLLAYFFHS